MKDIPPFLACLSTILEDGGCLSVICPSSRTNQNTVFIPIYYSEHVSKLVPVYPYDILYLMGFEPTYAPILDYKSSTIASRL